MWWTIIFVFLSSDRPWGERSAPGAEVSKGTSPRAVDADMLDIDALWIQKIVLYGKGETVRSERGPRKEHISTLPFLSPPQKKYMGKKSVKK